MPTENISNTTAELESTDTNVCNETAENNIAPKSTEKRSSSVRRRYAIRIYTDNVNVDNLEPIGIYSISDMTCESTHMLLEKLYSAGYNNAYGKYPQILDDDAKFAITVRSESKTFVLSSYTTDFRNKTLIPGIIVKSLV